MQSIWEQKLKDFGMDDLPVQHVSFRPVTLDSDWYVKFKKIRREFLQSLSDSVEELMLMNLSMPMLMGLLQNMELPENLSIKFKRPLMYGGEISVDNMYLVAMHPYGQLLDRFLIDQAMDYMAKMGKTPTAGYDYAPELFVPNPAKKVYVPTLRSMNNGAGGNTTSDRMSEIASAIVAQQMTQGKN